MSLFLCEQSGNLTLDSAADIVMNTKGTAGRENCEFSVERPECSVLSEMLSTVTDSLYTILFNFPGGSEARESPAVQETRVLSLGREDALEKGMSTPSSILTSIHGQRSLASYSPRGHKELNTTE